MDPAVGFAGDAGLGFGDGFDDKSGIAAEGIEASALRGLVVSVRNDCRFEKGGCGDATDGCSPDGTGEGFCVVLMTEDGDYS
jgi:hypothetical protein